MYIYAHALLRGTLWIVGVLQLRNSEMTTGDHSSGYSSSIDNGDDNSSEASIYTSCVTDDEEWLKDDDGAT